AEALDAGIRVFEDFHALACSLGQIGVLRFLCALDVLAKLLFEELHVGVSRLRILAELGELLLAQVLLSDEEVDLAVGRPLLLGFTLGAILVLVALFAFTLFVFGAALFGLVLLGLFLSTLRWLLVRGCRWLLLVSAHVPAL